MTAEGWVIVIGAIAAAITGIWAAVSGSRRQTRADALIEWQTIVKQLQKDRDDQGTEIRALTAEVFKLHESGTKCQTENARLTAENTEMRGESRLQQAAIQRLQALIGDEMPATNIPGLVIADIDGVIREFSPSLTPLLHWLPKDVRGKNIEVLIPERYREKHRAGMAGIKATGTPPWSDRIISGHGLTKEGGEVPVSITLSGWQTTKGDWLISAEVRRRPVTQLVPESGS